ncbi:F-box protein skip16 [Thalictrum thalictroides]|uniref:F-box protein skip16 n=1 Tax=Thalictrum thalictroides TaxID=46969 RepID=A0A7J6XCM6_THATH|nr:F-box protein skip16 [Thalictrum thalictroides]
MMMTKTMEMVFLDGLGDLSLHLIALKLGPKDTAVLACVNKRLRDSAYEETLWRTFCQHDLHITTPHDPSGNPTQSFKLAYQLWRHSFSMYPWPLVKRVHNCWSTLKNWLSLHFPEAAHTLQIGASESDIKLLEDKLSVKLPLSTKLLYRFCNGQLLPDHDTPLGSPLGLIGGYHFYNHLVNVYLLPLPQVISKTKDFVRHLGFSNRSKYIVVASSSTYNQKLFFLNCISGQLYVGTNNLSTDGEMMPCVSVPAVIQRDSMLLWLEEHARRLETGIIHLRHQGKIPRINLFPQEAPFCSTAVTNGVQIRASAVFVPELSNLQEESEKYWFSYSIRMSLLSEEHIASGTPLTSCQLYWRHWIIRANDFVVSDVDGEAVIGKYPLLHPDGKEFIYESCTPLPSCPGSIDGTFTFVPGRLTNPKGGPFMVEVAQFPLQLPDFIY